MGAFFCLRESPGNSPKSILILCNILHICLNLASKSLYLHVNMQYNTLLWAI